MMMMKSCSTTTSRLLLLLLTFSLQTGSRNGVVLVVYGQESPKYKSLQFEDTIPLRQNFCNVAQEVANGTIELRDALRGHELRPGIFIEEYLEIEPKNSSGIINKEYPGLLGVLLDELSQRAGFTWRNSFGITIDPVPYFRSNNGTDDINTIPTSEAYSNLLEWTATIYDFSADWWPNTIDRLNRGITFQTPWYNADIILIGSRDPLAASMNKQFSILSWLEPFEPLVWLVTIITIVISAIIYQVLEKYDTQTDDNELENDTGWNIFLSTITFTGHFMYGPRTNAARVFTASMALIALLIGSAYTANLASFLVVRNAPVIAVSTLDDVKKMGGAVCVSSLTDAAANVRRISQVKLIEMDTELSIFQGVVNGDCLIAATTEVSWRLHENDNVANPGCILQRTGSTIKQIPASFGFLADSGKFCSTLIRDVLNIHMAEMEKEGFIENAWTFEAARRITTTECSLSTKVRNQNDSDEMVRLGLIDMGGIFIAHYVFTVIAILMALIIKKNKQRKEQQQKQPRTNNSTITPTKMRSEYSNVKQHTTNSDDEKLESIIAFVREMQQKNNNATKSRNNYNSQEPVVVREMPNFGKKDVRKNYNQEEKVVNHHFQDNGDDDPETQFGTSDLF